VDGQEFRPLDSNARSENCGRRRQHSARGGKFNDAVVKGLGDVEITRAVEYQADRIGVLSKVSEDGAGARECSAGIGEFDDVIGCIKRICVMSTRP